MRYVFVRYFLNYIRTISQELRLQARSTQDNLLLSVARHRFFLRN